MNPRVSTTAVKRRHQVELARCRQDPVAFIEYVFGVKLDPEQIGWIRFWQEHEASVLHAGVGIGKTTLARGFVLWLLGGCPTEMGIWLGATQRQPKQQLATMARMIEAEGKRSRLHHVFPHLRPGPIWRSTEIEVVRELTGLDSSPTVQVFGAYSESVLGSRATILVIDDLCNFNNTLTEDGREKMIEWLSTVLSRLTKDNVRIIVLGNYWHKNDALMDLANNKGFAYRKTPAFTRDPEAPEDPERWIMTCPSALSSKAAIVLAKRLGPRKATQMLECEKPDLNLGRFKELWFEAALAAGVGMPFRPPRVFYPCFTGVDFGHDSQPGSDRTAMVTAILRPDGRKQIIDVRSGTWDSEQLTAQFTEIRLRYGSTIGVENNGAQRLVARMITNTTAIPLIEHNTNQFNKRDIVNGVEGMAISLQSGEWIFPCPPAPKLGHKLGALDDDTPSAEAVELFGDDPTTAKPSRASRDLVRGMPDAEILALHDEALVYDPSRPRKHTGDRLMAWWILSELIRKSALTEYDQSVLPAVDVPDFDLFSR